METRGSGRPDYHHRVVDDELDELLAGIPAVVLEGPRGVGKTATGSRRSDTVLSLDRFEVRQALKLNLERLETGEGTFFLDEWQRLPQVWDVVRHAVDHGALPGRFLLAGSAVPTIYPAHSGAGRLVRLRMRPLALAERDLVQPSVSLASLLTGTRPAINGQCPLRLPDYVQEITGSGLPGIRRLAPRLRSVQLGAYVTNLIEHDFPEQGHSVRRPQLLREWLSAYAAATSTCATYTAIMEAATPGQGEKPSRKATTAYREILSQLWLLDPLPGWLPTHNRLSRLTVAPKHHLADPALAAWLLDVDEQALLAGLPATAHRGMQRQEGSLLGLLFESLVTLSVRTYAQAAQGRVYHARTKNGEQEVDLIVTGKAGRVVALEVKLTAFADDDDVKHLRWLRTQLGENLADAAVITAGPMAYRRDDGIAVIPAALLGP